jgi:tetratricopeptide (TPR) repeat protein
MRENGAVSGAAADAVVSRLCASAAFVNAPQLRRLLQYLVGSAIANRQHLKAYTIAVEALGRPDDFDADRDPIVRVQASRLRRALAAYYKADGKRDDVRVQLPIGSYNLVFESQTPIPDDPLPSTSPRRRASAFACVAGLLIAVAGLVIVSHDNGTIVGPRLTDRASKPNVAIPQGNGLPTIVVRPFQFQGSAERYGLRVLITSALARFASVNTVYEPRPDQDHTAAIEMPKQDRYELKTYVSSVGDQTELTFQLLDSSESSTIWTRSFTVPRDRSSVETQQMIAGTLASTLLQPYGIIPSHDRARHIRTNQGEPKYRCILQAMDALHSASEVDYAGAVRCLEATVNLDPSYSLAYAYLAVLHNHYFQYALDADPTGRSTLDKALGAARRAVETKPCSSRAQYAMYLTLFNLGDFDMAGAAFAKAIAMNKFNMPIQAEHAGRLITLGEIYEGRTILESIDPAFATRTCTHEFFSFLGHYLSDQQHEAAHRAKQIACPAFPYAFIAKALAAYAANDGETATAHLQELYIQFPIWRTAPRKALTRLFPASEIADRILRDLKLSPQTDDTLR